MSARRIVLAGLSLVTIPGLAWLVPPEPAQAQNAACEASWPRLQQIERDREAAREAVRLYWAQRNPRQLELYRQSLREAIGQGRVTPGLERIAADLSFWMVIDPPDHHALAVQQEVLQVADRLARAVPASSAPLPEEPELAGRLRLALARLNRSWQDLNKERSSHVCLRPVASAIDPLPWEAPRPDRSMFVRASALAVVQSLSSEPSTALVCAETREVLAALEDEEKLAVEAVQMRWALDNHENIEGYLYELRNAQQQGKVAGSLQRIANGLNLPLHPGANEAAKLQAQAGVLQALERVDVEFGAVLEERKPTPEYLAKDTPRADLELSAERARYQADLRRRRMAELNCSALTLPPVEPFRRRSDPAAVGAPPQPGPNTAQVCAETRAVLVQLERDENAAYLPRWAMADDYHDSYFAIVALRNAEEARKLAPEFDELANLFGMDPTQMTQAQKLAAQPGLLSQIVALADRVRGATGRPKDDFNHPAVFDAVSAAMEDPDEDAPAVDPAVRSREALIEDGYYQAYSQAQLRRQRMQDLNCNALPTESNMSTSGTLQRFSTKLKENLEAGIQTYTYGDNWAEKVIVGDPPDRRRIRWTFAGVPGSLSPGDEFTITVTGELDFKPAGSERSANNSAGLRVEGLTAIREDNAYFYQGDKREGTYIYRVPLDAKKVVIELGADNGQGTFMRHCYGACTP